MPLEQSTRQITVHTVLGANRFGLKTMDLHDGLSKLFKMSLELVSDDGKIDFDDLLGTPIMVQAERAPGKFRQYHGFITEMQFSGSVGRFYEYHVTARPWLWFLAQNKECKIFHEQSIPDIAEAIFEDNGFTDYELKLKGNYEKREYTAQYCESDLDFLNRHFEAVGIYYYVIHDDGVHKVILTDSMSMHEAEPEFGTFEYFAEDAFGEKRREGVYRWSVGKRIKPTTATLRSFDFKNPSVDLTGAGAISRKHAISDIEVFQYPSDFLEKGGGDSLAVQRVQERQSLHEVASATCNVRGVATGRTFALKNHPIAGFNAEYLITEIRHTLTGQAYETGQDDGSSSYACTFNAIPVTEAYRPPLVTPMPNIGGPQTAFVVSDGDNEIDMDEHGRALLHFHWERYGKFSRRVRVSQSWAGSSYGTMFFPRVGQEVIVEFQHGDPDQPLVTGRVYNGTNQYPYNPKDNPNLSAIRTNTVNGTGFQELRFDDTQGEEEMYVHAQKDMNMLVLNDTHDHIKNNRHETVDNNVYHEVRAELHQTVLSDAYLQHDAHHLTVGTDLLADAGSNIVLNSGQNIHVSAGMNLVMEATSGLTLKVGGSFITLNSGGVFVSGPLVNVNSGGSALSGPGTQPQPPEPPIVPDEHEGGHAEEPVEIVTMEDIQRNPASAALLSAAESRKPFCEICERAKNAS